MSHHSTTNGCAGCNRPDEADNMVQCDACDAWWYFSCADVSGSITDRAWVCTRCKQASRASSRVSITSRSSSRLADSMARLRERQELEKQRADVELEKKFLQEQRQLLEATIAAEEEKRSRVSRGDSLRRVQDWIGNSADQQTSAAGDNRVPAASAIQQHISDLSQMDPDAGAVGNNDELPSGLPSDLDIQQHSSPLRDPTVSVLVEIDNSMGPNALHDYVDQRKAMDLIRDLRVRLERCLEQSKSTYPQFSELQQQLEICKNEIQGMHSTVHRLVTVSSSDAQAGALNAEEADGN